MDGTAGRLRQPHQQWRDDGRESLLADELLQPLQFLIFRVSQFVAHFSPANPAARAAALPVYGQVVSDDAIP